MFEKLMRSRNGFWENGAAVFIDRSGYYIRIAVGTPDNYILTPDGERLAAELANTSSDTVKSRKKREPKVAQPVADPDDINLDDI